MDLSWFNYYIRIVGKDVATFPFYGHTFKVIAKGFSDSIVLLVFREYKVLYLNLFAIADNYFVIRNCSLVNIEAGYLKIFASYPVTHEGVCLKI